MQEQNIEQSTSENSRFNDGDELMMVRVRFPGNAKSHAFYVGKRNFQYGQTVVAMSDRGLTTGYINSFPYKVTYQNSMNQIKSIARVATDDDIREQKDNYSKEKKAEVLCLDLIEKYKLNMVLTHVEYVQNGNKAVFYFNAPQRVDFRELVKDLVKELKMRIELRQISVRDRTAALGAIGVCGLQTCCSSFLKNYGQVNIKMPKNQNLALIPSRINGVCGQIKCCMKYEDEVYTEKQKKLPQDGSIIMTTNGDRGKVYRLHTFIEQFEMLTEKGQRRRYTKEMFDKSSKVSKDYQFPKKFEHIIDETREIIGLKKEELPPLEDYLVEQENDSVDEEATEAASGQEKSIGQQNTPKKTQEKESKNPRQQKQNGNNKNRRYNKNNQSSKNSVKAQEKQGSTDKDQKRSSNNKKRRPHNKNKNRQRPEQTKR